MTGTWQGLAHQPAFNASTMLLLTDGTVMCQSQGASDWYKLTPDVFGNYVNGQWTQLASLPSNSAIPPSKGGPANAPEYYPSAVLRDGRVFVAGGEYNGSAQPDLLVAEIYDPAADSWTYISTPSGWANIGDAPCCVLPDGRVLLGSIFSTQTALYDPVANNWSAAANKGDSSSEETWTLLPDGTVLTVQCSNAPNAEKYVIATDTWVSAGSTPSTLPQACPGFISEIGPALLLPDGRVFAVGATGNTALYTSPGLPAQAGIWAAGPTFMDFSGNTLYPMDAPGCLLPNGKVLCIASPDPVCSYPSPTTFFEYDPASNTLDRITNPSNVGGPAYEGRMLLLPTGQVLFSNGTSDVEVYTPGGSPDPSWKPQITNYPANVQPGQTYTLSGRQLNGLSQAVSYGDDASMATNYPLVRIHSNGSGQAWYPRTFDHSTMGVATGSTIVSTRFQIPAGLPLGAYELAVIANGIASDRVPVNVRLVTWANPADIVYGTPLAGTQLNATSMVPGTFVYTPPLGTVLSASPNQTLSVHFIPNDLITYQAETVTVQINVSKATPVINWTNPPNIVFGIALDGTQLNATATWVVSGSTITVPGIFTYSPPAGTVLNAGTRTLNASFLPNDTSNYNPAHATVQIYVLKATPTINWANPPDIDHGTALDGTQLNATATSLVSGNLVTVPGTFIYVPPVGTVLSVGIHQALIVVFSPTDIANYNPASATVRINVLHGYPVIESVTFSPTWVKAGDRLRVTVLVKNDSIKPHPTEGPNPGFEYSEGDTYETKGPPLVNGAYRIGVDLEKSPYLVHPLYRWGFGHTLAPGETLTVTGYIRFHDSNQHNGAYYAAMIEEPNHVIQDRQGTSFITIFGQPN